MPSNLWLASHPLESYSSLQEGSLLSLFGWSAKIRVKTFKVGVNFNMHTPFQCHPEASLTLDLVDAHLPPRGKGCCFSITQLVRWRLDISAYSSFEEYLSLLDRWHMCNYRKSSQKFTQYGTKTLLLKNDWSEHVGTVYSLYLNVANKYGNKLYTRHFFEQIAKREDYSLITAWFEGKMIGFFVLQDEAPTLHSSCCGFDYHHSSKSYTYTWLTFEIIRLAIEAKKYQTVSAGLSADEEKRAIGFQPVLSRIDIYARGLILRKTLQCISAITIATLNSKSELKLLFREPIAKLIRPAKSPF
jgi:hypothetical protein